MNAMPEKIRDIQNHHIDSTIWDKFRFRNDDIIIGTYSKSGTTWMQQIISQLMSGGKEGLPVSDMSPWVELRVPPQDVKLPMIEAQTHRRFLKTHLPVDAFVFSDKAKYIYIGRDGRDIVWSLYNHHINGNEAWYDALNNTPGRVGPPLDPPIGEPPVYFENWLDNDGAPFWSFWENVRSWWQVRDLPNVKLIHFANFKADMEGQIREIAEFIDVEVDDATMKDVLRHCSFDYMKSNAEQTVPLGGAFWEGGAKTFIHKGANGRWKTELPAELSQRYEQMAREQLGEACARWIETGAS